MEGGSISTIMFMWYYWPQRVIFNKSMCYLCLKGSISQLLFENIFCLQTFHPARWNDWCSRQNSTLSMATTAVSNNTWLEHACQLSKWSEDTGFLGVFSIVFSLSFLFYFLLALAFFCLVFLPPSLSNCLFSLVLQKRGIKHISHLILWEGPNRFDFFKIAHCG